MSENSKSSRIRHVVSLHRSLAQISRYEESFEREIWNY